MNKLPNMRPLLIVMFLFQVAFFAFPAIWAYFTRERYGWDSLTIGYSLGLFGISMAIVQGVIIRFIFKWIGENGTVITGFCFALAAFAGLVFLTDGRTVMIFTPVGAVAAIAIPAIQQIMSRVTPDDAQGALQGLLSSLNALAFIVAPVIASWSFAIATRPNGAFYVPGAPFVLSFGLAAAGLFVFVRSTRNTTQTKAESQT